MCDTIKHIVFYKQKMYIRMCVFVLAIPLSSSTYADEKNSVFSGVPSGLLKSLDKVSFTDESSTRKVSEDQKNDSYSVVPYHQPPVPNAYPSAFDCKNTHTCIPEKRKKSWPEVFLGIFAIFKL